jgi:hypothetical protein
VVDLRHRKLALLAQVSEHIRLPIEVRLPGTVHLRDHGGAVGELRPVDLPYASSAHRSCVEEALAQGGDASGDDRFRRHGRLAGTAAGCP